jgi:hypothetical protein
MGPSGVGLDADELAKQWDGNDWMKEDERRPEGWVDATSFVSESWNIKDTGKWSVEEVKWRLDYLKGFLRGIWVGAGAGSEKVEVVVVTHSSLLRKLVKNGKL